MIKATVEKFKNNEVLKIRITGKAGQYLATIEAYPNHNNTGYWVQLDTTASIMKIAIDK